MSGSGFDESADVVSRAWPSSDSSRLGWGGRYLWLPPLYWYYLDKNYGSRVYLFLNDFCMLSCFWTEQMLKYSMAMMETICVSGCRNVWPSFKCKNILNLIIVFCLRFVVSYYYTKRVRNKHLREIYSLVSDSKWPKHAIKYNIYLGNFVSFKNTCQPIWGVQCVTDVPLWFVVLHWDGPCWLA